MMRLLVCNQSVAVVRLAPVLWMEQRMLQSMPKYRTWLVAFLQTADALSFFSLAFEAPCQLRHMNSCGVMTSKDLRGLTAP